MEEREATTDLSGLGAEELRGELTTLAAHLTAAECRWLQLLAEFDRRELWLQWGCRTCAAFLGWQCGLDKRAAQEKLRVARALESLPLVTKAFAEGRLSYSKVRAITRIATPEIEADLVTLGLHATASHIESVVRAYRGVLSKEEETAKAVERRANRHHRFDSDDDGCLVGSYRLTPEDGAAFLAGVDAAAEYVRSTNPEIGYGASLADALLVMSETFLAAGPVARKAGDRFMAMVNIDADVLHFDSNGECALHNGPARSRERAPTHVRLLGCARPARTRRRGARHRAQEPDHPTEHQARAAAARHHLPLARLRRSSLPRRPSRAPLDPRRRHEPEEPRSLVLASPLPRPRRGLVAHHPRGRLAPHP